MRLIVLTSRFPYPLDKGDKLRAFHQLKSLSKNNEIHLISLSDTLVESNHEQELKKYCKSVHVFKLKKWKILLNLAMGLFSNKPFQVKYFYQAAIHKKITRLIKAIDPDHIYCQLIRCVPYVQHEHHYSKTLDYMDAFSKGIERRINSASWMKPIFKIEAQRLVKYENLAFEYFDNHCIISEHDRSYIFHEKKNQIKIISNGIDSHYFSSKEVKKKYDLVFIGNLSYAPNIDTSLYIAQELLPLLKEKFPLIKVLICGADPSYQLKKLANDNIEIIGWTPDIRNAYLAGKIFLAPLRIGTGLQNKLLEAMSLGLPCITSPLANQALKAKDGEQILVANSLEQYIQQIDLLLSNQQIRESIGGKAREYIKAAFDWESSVAELEKIMKAKQNNI